MAKAAPTRAVVSRVARGAVGLAVAGCIAVAALLLWRPALVWPPAEPAVTVPSDVPIRFAIPEGTRDQIATMTEASIAPPIAAPQAVVRAPSPPRTVATDSAIRAVPPPADERVDSLGRAETLVESFAGAPDRSSTRGEVAAQVTPPESPQPAVVAIPVPAPQPVVAALQAPLPPAATKPDPAVPSVGTTATVISSAAAVVEHVLPQIEPASPAVTPARTYGELPARSDTQPAQVARVIAMAPKSLAELVAQAAQETTTGGAAAITPPAPPTPRLLAGPALAGRPQRPLHESEVASQPSPSTAAAAAEPTGQRPPPAARPAHEGTTSRAARVKSALKSVYKQALSPLETSLWSAFSTSSQSEKAEKPAAAAKPATARAARASKAGAAERSWTGGFFERH